MTHKVKLLLMGLGIVVLAAVVWFLVLSPIRGDIRDTEQAILKEQNDVQAANTALRLAEDTRAEGKRNQMRLLELAKMVPLTEELPSLLLQIQDLADRAGIEFIQVTPGQASESLSGAFQAIPLELRFSGTFFDVNDFIYRAEQMVAGPGRLLAIKSIDLTLGGEDSEAPAAGKSPDLEVAMSVYAFISGGGSTPGVTVTPPATSGENTNSTTPAAATDTEQ